MRTLGIRDPDGPFFLDKRGNKSVASFLLFHPCNPQEQMFHASQQQFL